MRLNHGQYCRRFGRGSTLELINCLTTAKGEAEELKSQLDRGRDIKYFSEQLFKQLYDLADLVARNIGAFIGYLNKANIKGQKFKERI